MFLKYLTRRVASNSKKLPLQVAFTTVLVVPFVTQIILAVGITGWLSLRNGRSAVNNVATQLRSEITAHIHDKLNHYLETPHLINQLNADAARLGQIDFTNSKNLEPHLWRQIQLYGGLSSIGFGSESGNYTAADRRGNALRRGRKDASSPDGALRMYETDNLANPTRLAYTGKPNYDPRTRPWYQLGKTAGEGRWTHIFTYSAQPIFVISAVRPIFDRSNKFLGVMLTDLILCDISHFLQKLNVGQSGQTFIMERSGLLVAGSTVDQPFTVSNGQAIRIKAIDSTSPLIRSTAQYLTQQFGNLTQIKSSQQLEFMMNGKRQFLQVAPYLDKRGLDWLIVVVVPEADFMQQIEANTRSTILLCLLALGIAIFVGLLSARWLVAPILRLSAAAKTLADGEWDKTVPIEREDELGVLAGAFNRMAGQVQESLLALQQREAKLAEAQKIAHLGSWELDFTTQSVTWSDELFRIYGLEPTSNPLSFQDAIHLIHPDDFELVKRIFEQAISEGKSYEFDYRIVRSDGSIRYVYGKGQPTLDQSGRTIGLFGTIMDITDRKQAEIERADLLKREQEARAKAEEANRIKDEFLAVLSHELRTPLNPILGWSKLLRSRALTPEKTTYALETIERNAKLQTQLIEDLLDVSRIMRGKLSLNFSPVTLNPIIEAALETVRLSAQAKSIQLNTGLAGDNRQVAGDANRLQQVVWNLLSNAVKFTPSNGRVEIGLDYTDTHATIAVSDTGKGIKPEFLPHVFEYFRQENSTTTRVFGGLGLGLAIVHHLVELHGGTVSAVSLGEDQGATFSVTLPLMPTQHEATHAHSQLELSSDLKGIRVLVVDDEADMREFVSCLLTEHGAQVTVVKSACEALSKLSQVQPDVLLSDIGMPEVDGYMLMRQLRTRTPEQGGQIPAIALTAYAGGIDREQAIAAGFQKHIPKPVEPDQLVAAIATLIEHK
jgi:PAS domain S-box-containing protein